VSTLEEARAHYEAGRYQQAREAALGALDAQPDDVDLLRVAGRAGVEAGAEDAVEHLRRVSELRPDDAISWRDLGDALATEGRGEEAQEAFRRAVDLDPADEVSLTGLGHTAYAAGDESGAVSYLEQAAEHAGGLSTATINLVDMYRSIGQPEAALAAAVKVADAQPDDALAALDVAELCLELGQHEDASRAFERVRAADEIADHEVYALHGMIAAEIAREQYGAALELAREASALDRGRTVGILAFLEAQVSGPGEEPPPTREEVDAALQASLAEHRRAHAEDRRLASEDLYA
jgi:Flp pilus assembly protein TadD